MGRLTDNDKSFGPITWGPTSGWRPWIFEWRSGGDQYDEGKPRNHLVVYLLGWVIRIWMPYLIPPYRRKVIAGWDEATVARIGRNWYYDTHERVFGVSLHNGHLNIKFGRQTHDSSTTQDWGCFLPWTQWTHVRHTLYDTEGRLWAELEGLRMRWEAKKAVEESCPTVQFDFDDYDGQRIRATTRMEEHEWHFGAKMFKWLRFFRKPKVRRSIRIEFDKEVGPEKGSWKGGTIGTGIDMLPGELHEAAFKRYCNEEHRSKYRRFKVSYVGRVQPVPVQAIGEGGQANAVHQ